jgi:hypothetical protein
MVQYALDNPGFNFDVLSDGDDTLMFYEKGTLTIDSIVDHFALAGHELRVDGVTDVFSDILFCQHRFVGDVMVRNPEEIMEKALTVTNSLTQVSPTDYFAGIGKGLLAVYGVIPEMRSIAKMLIDLNPNAPHTSVYWLKFPQEGELAVGEIFNLYPCDLSLVIEETRNLVSYLLEGK